MSFPQSIWYDYYTPGKTYSERGRIDRLEVESVWTSPRGKQYCTLVFVDKNYEPKKYVKKEDVIYINARCEILPDSKDGMLYQPCVFNPHQIYDTLWNYLYKPENSLYKPSKAIKDALIKLDNKILNASKTVQDEFVLSGIRVGYSLYNYNYPVEIDEWTYNQYKLRKESEIA